jgi:hypothetical protein
MAKGAGQYQVKKCNTGYFTDLFFTSGNGSTKPDKGST